MATPGSVLSFPLSLNQIQIRESINTLAIIQKFNHNGFIRQS